MRLTRKLTLGGVVLSVIPIALGIVALATRVWLRLTSNTGSFNATTYGLFGCTGNSCLPNPESPVAQGLIIAGVAAIAAGVIITLIIDIVTKDRWIHLHLLPGILLFAGPTLILIGLLIYAKHVFENVFVGLGRPSTLILGFSIILIIIACLLGFLTAIYFAFVAGLRHRRNQKIQGAPVVRVIQELPGTPVSIVDRSERF